MKRTCIICAGGPEAGLPCLPLPEGAYILCADSGLRLAERLGLTPDLVLGDFDSLGAAPEGYPVMTVPVEKDDTDTMLAARVALEKGYRDIRICGAFGGRLDHTLANIQTLEFLMDAGAEGILIGARDWACMQGSGTARRYETPQGWSLSVFAWTERCTGVTLRGTKYPLENGTLTRGFPLGVSNAVTGGFAEVTCGEGRLLVTASRL